MKKSALIVLLVLALSFSTMLAAESLDGHSYSLENILIEQGEVVSQTVTALSYENVIDYSISSNQWESVHFYNDTAGADIGFEMENIENVITLQAFNIRPENYRGGGLHYAIYYKQIV